MDNETGRVDCATHPGIPAVQACAQCGRPGCENCTVEFMGQQLCYWCRQGRLTLMQARPVAAVDPRPVVTWARVYSGCMILFSILYALGVTAYMSFVGTMMKTMPGAGPPPPVAFFNVMSGIGIGFGVAAVLISLVAFLPPALGPAPGRGWYWMWQMVAIIIGIASCILWGLCGLVSMVAGVILLIYWVKPEVRVYTDDVAAGRLLG